MNASDEGGVRGLSPLSVPRERPGTGETLVHDPQTHLTRPSDGREAGLVVPGRSTEVLISVAHRKFCKSMRQIDNKGSTDQRWHAFAPLHKDLNCSRVIASYRVWEFFVLSFGMHNQGGVSVGFVE